MPFSKCLRAKIYSNLNVYFDPKCCQSLLLKESDLLLFSLGSWTIPVFVQFSFFLYFELMKVFVKDFCEIVQAGVVIFGKQVDNDVLYRRLGTSLLMLILPCICPISFLS